MRAFAVATLGVSSEAEDAVNIALALAVELAASNERIDRLERLLTQQSGRDLAALKQLRFDGEAADQRNAALDAMMARVLRILIDPRQTRQPAG